VGYHRHPHYIREKRSRKRFQHDVRHGFIFDHFEWISVQDEDGSEYMELFYFDLTPMRQMILTRRTQRKIPTERDCDVRTIQRSWKEHRKTQCH
jgi:hypothetical protein